MQSEPLKESSTDPSVKTMKTSEIKTHSIFADLFTIDSSILDFITENIREKGFYPSHPLIVWKGENIVIDGHTRLKAAVAAKIEDVPVYERQFENEDEALQYAISEQKNRRNLTEAEFLRCVAALDHRKKRGGARIPSGCENTKAPDGAFGKSSVETARILDSSRRKIERARTVLDHADEETREAIDAGELTINRACNEIQAKRRAQKETRQSKFNSTNDNIEWAKWTWNPITGCKNDCVYCYARDIAKRFNGHFDPEFHSDRLAAPLNTPLPSSEDNGARNVFVCSMADLFGDWVPDEWIDAVLDAVRKAPDWNFIFLTKNPARLTTIDWPRNAWVGTTVDEQKRVAPACEAFKTINATVKFISAEPLREELEFEDMSMFDWLIIGGQSKNSREGEKQPKWRLVEALMTKARHFGIKVYFKPNLKVRPKEYPTG